MYHRIGNTEYYLPEMVGRSKDWFLETYSTILGSNIHNVWDELQVQIKVRGLYKKETLITKDVQQANNPIGKGKRAKRGLFN